MEMYMGKGRKLDEADELRFWFALRIMEIQMR